MPRLGAVALVSGALALTGCAETGASQEDLDRAYRHGARVAMRQAIKTADRRVAKARDNGYSQGWSRGWDDAVGAIRQEASNYVPTAPDPAPPFDESDYSSPDYSYDPDYSPSPPTTEDFGSGNGYVVTCADGTLSDSGGIQGACSHHGGVLP